MKLSVIIPSYRRPLDLKRCLEALKRQSRPADEVLVIVREDDTETSQLVSAYSETLQWLRAVFISKPGLIAALNCGLDHVTGDILVFTDDDSEAEKNWLELTEARFADANVGAVGGRDWLQLPEEPSRYFAAEVNKVGILSWYGKLHGNHHHPLRGHKRKVMFLKGVNMAFRKSALGSRRIDTNLRGSGSQVGSELDLCSQISQAGFTILFDDRILVKHYCAPRPKDDVRTDLTGPVWLDVCFNTHYLIAKHFGMFQSLAFFSYGRLLGTRYMPGLFAAIKWTLQGDRFIWKRFLQMTFVALSGLLAGRRMKIESAQNIPDFQSLSRHGSTAA
jgi:cellulose synthase/poly-beta-1,6-N-acetylglucosamine synthase-like glycosyltransferase